MTTPSHLFFKRVSFSSKMAPFSLELRPGAEAIVVDSEELGQGFIECALGLRAPRRGKIRLGNTNPEGSPSLRSRIGSLFPLEAPLPALGTVDNYLNRILQFRGTHSSRPAPELDTLPLLQALRKRPVESLSPIERRRIALGFALSLSEPLALFLYDPLRDLEPSEIDFTLGALSKLASATSIVTCLLPTHHGAERLGDRRHYLTPRNKDLKATRLSFLIESERPRQLASLLSSSTSILGTRFDSRRPQQLIVDTENEEEAARAIGQAIVESQSDVFELSRLPLSVNSTSKGTP